LEEYGSIFKVKEYAKQETSMKAGGSCFHTGFLLGLFCDPEYGDDMFLQNIS
jgi:hypothetical protein